MNLNTQARGVLPARVRLVIGPLFGRGEAAVDSTASAPEREAEAIEVPFPDLCERVDTMLTSSCFRRTRV
jgi:hypothetical protein